MSRRLAIPVLAALLAVTACGPVRSGTAGASPLGSAASATDSPTSSPTGSGTSSSPTDSSSTDSSPSPSVSSDAAGLARLVAAEALWQKAAPTSYRFRYQGACFCPHTPYLTTVRHGEVVSVTRAAPTKGSPPDEGNLPEVKYAPTIPAMFAELHRAYEGSSDSGHSFPGPAYKITVSYDEKYGFPTAVFIDWAKFTVDEESGYGVSDFVLLPAALPMR